MKKKFILFYLFLLIIDFSCITGLDYDYKTELIYVAFDKFKDKIKITNTRPLHQVNKIYTYKKFLFINDSNMGVHIIDNTNPSEPKNKGFLQIPFNEDISIKKDVLYADSLDELIAIDISEIEKNKINITKRLKMETYFLNNKFVFDKNKGISIGYKRTPEYKPRIILGLPYGCSSKSANNASVKENSNFSDKTNQGKGGSLARFSIVNDYLYTVTKSDINVFSLKDEKNPEKIGKVEIAKNRADVETIYAYKDKLFMGSSTGAYIYDNKEPQKPEFISKIEHIRSCDPVVVENNTAYITLRNGVSCRNGSNQLDVVDIADLKNPKIINSYNFKNPWGLAINEGNLFVCDYNSGVKVFDAKESSNLKEISNININKAKDIILNDNYLGIINTDDGIYEYDFSGVPKNTNFKKLSFIKVDIPNIDDGKVSVSYQIKDGKTEVYYDWYKELI
ncbi:MAG: hypothetical protein U0457_01470 [Candidatus Sericytochromatia bacterium]